MSVECCALRSSSNCQWYIWHFSRKAERVSTNSLEMSGTGSTMGEMHLGHHQQWDSYDAEVQALAAGAW